MEGIYWAKVSKRGITERKRAKIENPYLNNSGKYQLSMTSINCHHLQVIGRITGKFHQNPLKTVGGVTETRTSVDKMAKTDKGPKLW